MPTPRFAHHQTTVAVRARFTAIVVLLAALLAPAAAGAAAPQKYDKAAFEQAVRGYAPVVLHFCAGWSPLCQVQKPAVQLLLQEPALSPIKFFAVDFDRERQLRSTLGVYQQSTFVVFAGGHEVARSTGETSREALRLLFIKALPAEARSAAGNPTANPSTAPFSTRKPRP